MRPFRFVQILDGSHLEIVPLLRGHIQQVRLPDHCRVCAARGRSQRAPGVAVADEGHAGNCVRLDGIGLQRLCPEVASVLLGTQQVLTAAREEGTLQNTTCAPWASLHMLSSHDDTSSRMSMLLGSRCMCKQQTG